MGHLVTIPELKKALTIHSDLLYRSGGPVTARVKNAQGQEIYLSSEETCRIVLRDIELEPIMRFKFEKLVAGLKNFHGASLYEHIMGHSIDEALK